MFATLARRVTGWYVFVAVTLVVLVVAVAGAAVLTLYAHTAEETVESAIRQVGDFEPRARARHLSFEQAAAELQRRLERPGVQVRIFPPIPVAAGHGRDGKNVVYVAPRPLPGHAGTHTPPPPEPRVVRRDLRFRESGSGLGRALAQLLNIQPARARFMDGLVVMFPDPDRLAALLLTILALIVPIALLAGIAAWALARSITERTIRPLVDVTEALQRFAARDFSPTEVGVGARGEFEALARAYNAAAQQVAAAFDERRQAEDRMRQFVADAGHELRTPLTIVLGYLEMLRRRATDDERTNRMYASIASEGSRMRVLVDNLVLLARMEGSEQRDPAAFEVGELVDEVIEARRIIAPGVRFAVTHAVEATAIGERTEVHEALANVVDNALKYAPGSPIDVTLDGRDGMITIAVTDRGPGINDIDRAHIFERFYRGTVRGEIDGSGLGLAIAKRALERAGGTLELAASSPGGSTFILRLRADEIRHAPQKSAVAP